MTNIRKELFDLTMDKNIPLMAVFELTNQCNLNCAHCYLTGISKDNDLKTSKIKSAISQLYEMGCLYLVFTGGEVFIREDILELSKYARNYKFDLFIFTNATLLDENRINKLSELGNIHVEISLYGREGIHDGITKIKGSFDKTIRTVEMLSKRGMDVTIKCPIMNLNFKEYKWLLEYADKLNIKFKFDPAVTPRNNGDKSTLKYRLKKQQLQTIISEFYSESWFNEINRSKHEYNRMDDINKSKFLSTCSAGQNLIFISANGDVYPCGQILIPIGNIKREKLRNIWYGNKAVEFREFTMSKLDKCIDCKLALYCRRCMGLALLEDGNLLGKSEIACQIAEVTKQVTESYTRGEE